MTFLHESFGRFEKIAYLCPRDDEETRAAEGSECAEQAVGTACSKGETEGRKPNRTREVFLYFVWVGVWRRHSYHLVGFQGR